MAGPWCDPSTFARILAAVVTVFGLTLPVLAVGAPKHVMVAQLEQSLSALHSGPDSEIAGQLSVLELTERLRAAMLTGLKAGYR